MNVKEISVAQEIGKQIGLSKVKIECPVCKTNLSYGDYEQVLFCPGCNLEVELDVIIYEDLED